MEMLFCEAYLLLLFEIITPPIFFSFSFFHIFSFSDVEENSLMGIMFCLFGETVQSPGDCFDTLEISFRI